MPSNLQSRGRRAMMPRGVPHFQVGRHQKGAFDERYAVNKFEAKESMATGLHEFLMSIVPFIEQSQGCMSCQVLQNQERLNEYLVIECEIRSLRIKLP